MAYENFIDQHFEGIIALFSIVIGGISASIALFWRRFVKVDLLEAAFTNEIQKANMAHTNIEDELRLVRKELKDVMQELHETREDLAYLKGSLGSETSKTP